MPDFTKPKHTAHVATEVCAVLEQEALFLSKPFRVNEAGGLELLPEQPNDEDRARLVRDAETFRDWAPFEAKLAEAIAKKNISD